MKTKIPDHLHLVARHVHGQWVVSCLDFDLAAQDDSFEAAQRRLFDQVTSYVEEALAMDGGAHAEQLLNRRAPIGDWILFHAATVLQGIRSAKGFLRGYQRPFQYLSA